MRRLRFLRLPDRTPLGITATQKGGSVSRDIQPRLWGGPISITQDRSVLQVAPDSVHFSVDLSQSHFQTATVGGVSAPYDPRFHELSFCWDFGTGKEDRYRAPEHLLNEWHKADIAFGPDVSKMFTKPGTYKVKVTVLERISGMSSEAEVDVVVGDSAKLHVGPQTHVVAHDSDFGGAPENAILHNSLDKALQALGGAGATQRRLLLKRGGTYTISGEIVVNDSMTKHLDVGAWGSSGARPILRTTATSKPANIFNFFLNASDLPRRDARFSDLNFKGSWNPVTATGHVDEVCINALQSLNLIVSECEANNMSSFCRVQGAAAMVSTANRTHFHELAVNEYKSYPLFFGPLKDSRVALTGVRVAQNPAAYSNWPVGVDPNAGGPVRINCSHTYIDGCDIFSHNSHGNDDLGYPQPCLRLNDRPTIANDDLVTPVEGVRLNVQRCTLESGSTPIVIGGADFNKIRSVTTNTLIDKILFIGGFSVRPFLRSYNGGLTIRSCLFVLPETPYSGVGLDKGFIWLQIAPAGNADKTARNAPNRVYNNTFVMLRTNAQNNNFVPGQVVNAVADAYGENVAGTSPAYLDTKVENNVLYMPKLTPPVVEGIIQKDGVMQFDQGKPVAWNPRNDGRRIPSTGALLREFETPHDTLRRYMPTHPEAAGAATGDLVSHRDIRGEVRPVYPRRGAWDVTSGQ